MFFRCLLRKPCLTWRKVVICLTGSAMAVCIALDENRQYGEISPPFPSASLWRMLLPSLVKFKGWSPLVGSSWTFLFGVCMCGYVQSSVFSCECVLVGLWGCASEDESASARFVVQMRFSPADFLL